MKMHPLLREINSQIINLIEIPEIQFITLRFTAPVNGKFRDLTIASTTEFKVSGTITCHSNNCFSSSIKNIIIYIVKIHTAERSYIQQTI